ncbi:MAG: hypothetical protein LCH77_01675 [Actinobacteria bacterium]|nr:hypothetical protein [Actinomycetota bacterium]
MTAGDDTPTYGQSTGPQDGQIRPIPVPATPRDQLSEAERVLLAKREARRKSMNGMLAMSGGLATVIFLIIGFVFNGWAWGWIVFLIPGLMRTYLQHSE